VIEALLIGGDAVPGGGDAIDIENPATGDVVASPRAASHAQLDAAVVAAASADGEG
jgi:acyl-CoA reductase-like NAD-dependent aldehyde dehydrogenase